MTKSEKHVVKIILLFLLLLAVGCVVIGFIANEEPMLAAVILGFCWGRFMAKQLAKRI